MKATDARAELVAYLRHLLEQSGDAEGLTRFDVDAWVGLWTKEPLQELGGLTPERALRSASGRRRVRALLERMRGGLPG